jgi:molecular chaperone GrpE
VTDDLERSKQRGKVRVSDRRVQADATGQPDPADVATTAQADEPAPALEEVASKLAETERLAADRLDQMLRLKADFENYRKRVIREQTEIVERAALRVVETLLPVLDDLERTLKAARSHNADPAIIKGVELVQAKLHDALSAEGLERIQAEGAAFDPHQHEAISSESREGAEHTVLEVVRPGYKLKGRTIRPALVHVATPSEPSAPSDPADSTEQGAQE